MTTLNRAAYEALVAEDLAWLLEQPRTLERDHIEHIVRHSAEAYYAAFGIKSESTHDLSSPPQTAETDEPATAPPGNSSV